MSNLFGKRINVDFYNILNLVKEHFPESYVQTNQGEIHIKTKIGTIPNYQLAKISYDPSQNAYFLTEEEDLRRTGKNIDKSITNSLDSIVEEISNNHLMKSSEVSKEERVKPEKIFHYRNYPRD